MDLMANGIQTFLLYFEKALLFILIFLEFAILAVFFGKLRQYSKVQGKSEKWIGIFSKNLRSSTFPHITMTPEEETTVVGRVVKSAVENQGLSPDALERIFDVQESVERRELGRGLVFLGSVGTNAPFVGLVGTVIGILVAFNRFSASGGRGSTEVMTSISQALVATVAGLVVAIPAVIFFNILKSRSQRILEHSRELRGVIIARLLHLEGAKEAA